MAMMYAQMRALLNENSSGFAGGTPVDELPHLSLHEAVNELPIVILQMQNETYDTYQHQNDVIMEAAFGAEDYDTITEASFEDINNKIKAFFDKIIKWLKSILAKVTVAIDKLTMSGQQLWAKYKSRPELNKNFSGADDLTYNGYDFSKANALSSKTTTWDGKPQDLMNAAIPGIKTPAAFAETTKNWFRKVSDYDNNSEERAANAEQNYRTDGSLDKMGKADIEKMTSLDKSERNAKLIEKLTGVSVGDSWESDLRTEFYGDKHEIRYGDEGFTKDAIGALLGGKSVLDDIKRGYSNLLTATDKWKAETEREAANLKSEVEKMKIDNDKQSGKANAFSLASSYYTTYLSLIQDTYNAISSVKTFHYNYQKARYDQAKGMLGKLLSYKVPKKDNNGFDPEDELALEMLDFAI